MASKISKQSLSLDDFPVPAAYLEEGVLHPNRLLLVLTGHSAQDFEGRDAWLPVLFNHRADAIRMQHESDRQLGFPAARLCSLRTADGRELAVEWSSSLTGKGELWVYQCVRGAGELPVSSYGMTQEEVGDMLYWVDEEGRIASVNSNACEFMGYSPDEMLTMSVADLDPNYTKAGWDGVWRSLKKKKRVRFESAHRKKNGEILQVDILSQFSVLGDAEYACSTVRDITEVKRQHSSLAHDLAARENLLANLVGMAFRCKHDAGWTFEYVSGGAEQLLGFKPTELVDGRRGFASLVHPDDLQFLIAECSRGVASGRPYSMEYRVVCRDGTVKWVLDLARAIYADGKPTHVEGFITDITARKRAEEALRESQLLFTAFMDNNPAIAFLKDEDGRWLYVNNTLVRLLWKCDAPDWHGRRDEDLWDAESAREFRQNDLRVLQEDRAIQFEEVLRRKNGADDHFLSIKFPLRLPDGKRFLAGLSINISEQRAAQAAQRQMEDQMLHMQKLESLGVLAGGIAHDFNNLLTGIMGYADLAAFEVPENSTAAQSIGQISKSARRAAELTRQMLAYSGKGRFVVQPFDVGQMIHEMNGLLELAVSKRCRLVYDIAPGLPSVEGDPTQIRQVVMNLIINASEAIGDEDGNVRVTAGKRYCSRVLLRTAYLDEGLPSGDYVYVEVSDTGSGMDDETRRRLFDPFFTTKFAGRGLGMAAVLGIIRSHRGAITVESAPGKGSTFCVYLPISGKAVQPETVQPLFVNAKFKGTVLVVDDEAMVRELAQEMLQKVGFRVLTAVDGLDALAVFAANSDSIRTVLLDATMPNLDGPQTLKALRERAPGLRIILSSGYSESGISAQCGEHKPDGFIEKPYSIGKLVNVLSSLGEFDEEPVG